MTIIQALHLILLVSGLGLWIGRKAIWRVTKRSIKARIKRAAKQRKAARVAARKAVQSA